MALKEEKFFSSLHSYEHIVQVYYAFVHACHYSVYATFFFLMSRTCAIAIHRSMIRALWAGLVCEQRGELGPADGGGYRRLEEQTDEMLEEVLVEGQRSEVMTQLVTALNCEMVARTVGARFLFSFLSRWDQTQPRQWKGFTLTNSSCKIKEDSEI